MNSFQHRGKALKRNYNTTSDAVSLFNSVASLVMSQVVSLLSQSVTTLAAFSKTLFQSASLLSQHSLCRDPSYREVEHIAGFTLPQCSVQILKWKWASLPQ